MTLLTSEQREDVWKRYMSDASEINDAFGNFLKNDLLTATGDIDDWVEAGSKGQLKNAISEPCKSEMTSQQQDDLHNLVLNKRQGEF